ncbi:MAG: ABC transporter ATP-binding protein [Desulfovibrio sp.]|jgi:ABC-type Fe3+/spermidine/putrescine transport system ATPase subunit|nr:ABC transporter ATP-binding protein [Desulfovibrio sp.]
MASITLDGLVKRFGALTVVDRISLDIEDGEFFTLLGPSGCGKTTLLRMLAGFVAPDEGDIRFAGKSIVAVPPYRRETGMVFQNYALFPHMTVFENVAYGLKARKRPAPEIRAKVDEMLAGVRLDGFGERRPRQLSGGQQQRVALARALVVRPKVLLMDEPLSNLDARLRVDMREEIRSIQKEFGITTVYVTHDQEEAMAVSDRIAVLAEGRLRQAGSPRDVYMHPADAFTAEFMGDCVMLDVTAEPSGPAENSGGTYAPPAGLAGFIKDMPLVLDIGACPAPPFTLMLRPDWIETAGGRDCPNRFTGIVKESIFAGAHVLYRVQALGRTMRVKTPAPADGELRRPGESLEFCFAPDRPVLLG